MTIDLSGLLGRGVTPATHVSRLEMSGASPMGDPELFRHVERGVYGHGHVHGHEYGYGGGKAGWKGKHSAMSALTLLVFLFYINLLQTCIQENMATTGTTMLMLVARNRSRPLIRPSRQIRQSEGQTDALPGPGVYWDTNVLFRRKGEPWNNCSASEQKHSARIGDEGVDQEASNTVTARDEDNSARDKTTDFDDYQENRDLFVKGLKSKEDYSETGKKLSVNTTSFLHKQLHVSDNELTHKDDELSSTEDDRDLTLTNTDHNYHKYYKESQDYDFSDDSDGWYYYHYENDNRPQIEVSTPEANDRGPVDDRYKLEESENLYPFTNLGSSVWKIMTSVSNAVIQRLYSGIDVAQCYGLVVCEAHRVGTAWGDSGLLLASSLSEIMMWLYGENDEDRRLITKAAVVGGQRQSCRVQMQQCENKSQDRSMLPAMATVLELLF